MMLALEGLTKSYKDKVALRDITFSFTPGIYGLLGPNGAGKSTMMNLITDNLVPTSGRVLLDGKSIGELGAGYRKLLGYMPQQQNIYPDLTLRRFLFFMASLKGLSKSEAEADIDRFVSLVNLSDVLSKKLGAFSGGTGRAHGGPRPEGANPGPQPDFGGCERQDCHYCDPRGHGRGIYRERDYYAERGGDSAERFSVDAS